MVVERILVSCVDHGCESPEIRMFRMTPAMVASWTLLFAVSTTALADPSPGVGEDGLQKERQAAFDHVVSDYPTKGKSGLLDQAQSCYIEASSLDAVRRCYLLDLTTRMIDAHAKMVEQRERIPTQSDFAQADAAASQRLSSLGVAEGPALIQGWSLEAKSHVTREQREEVFAMLHQG